MIDGEKKAPGTCKTIKISSVCIVRNPEGEMKEERTEVIFKAIIAIFKSNNC